MPESLSYRYYQVSRGVYVPFLGKIEDSEYVEVFAGQVPCGDGDPRQALEDLFVLHNAADRPRGQVIRSMSVGDVVLLEGMGYWFCADVGWTPIERERLTILTGKTLLRGELVDLPA